MKLILSEFISFVKDPYSQANSILSRRDKFLKLLKALILTLILVCLYNVVVLLMKKFILNGYENVFTQDLNLAFNRVYVIFFTVLLGPLCEELIFRLPLSFKKKDINLSFFVIWGIVGYMLIGSHFFSNINRELTNFCKYIYLFSGGIILYFINSVKDTSFENIKKSAGKYIVYGSIIIFALSHLSNINDFSIRLLPLYLIDLFPIFISGISISFCRIRLGFFYGFIFHAIWNLFPALIQFFG